MPNEKLPDTFWESEEERLAFEKREAEKGTTVQDLASIPADRELRPGASGVQISQPKEQKHSQASRIAPGSTISSGSTTESNQVVIAQPVKPDSFKPMVGVGESGALNPTDIDQQWRMACALSQTGMLGPTYEGKPGAVMLAINMAMEKGKNPFSYLASTYEVKGRITEWGADALGAVLASGRVKEFKVVYLSKEGKQLDEMDIITPVWAVAAIGERSDLPVRVIRYFTEEDARKANLLGNPKKEVWSQYTRRMLETKAIGAMLKVCFPDVIAGIPMPEYDEHEKPDPGANTASTGASGGAKWRLLGNQQEAQTTGEVPTVPGVRTTPGEQVEPSRSGACSDLQGDAERSPSRTDPALQNLSHGAAQVMEPVPVAPPKGSKRATPKRLGNNATPLST